MHKLIVSLVIAASEPQSPPLMQKMRLRVYARNDDMNTISLYLWESVSFLCHD